MRPQAPRGDWRRYWRRLPADESIAAYFVAADGLTSLTQVSAAANEHVRLGSPQTHYRS
jgi:hypothetical protein